MSRVKPVALSILVGALIIAGAITYGQRYGAIHIADGFVLKIDKLTGKTDLCALDGADNALQVSLSCANELKK